jgi:hypothetical protein
VSQRRVEAMIALQMLHMLRRIMYCTHVYLRDCRLEAAASAGRHQSANVNANAVSKGKGQHSSDNVHWASCCVITCNRSSSCSKQQAA